MIVRILRLMSLDRVAASGCCSRLEANSREQREQRENERTGSGEWEPQMIRGSEERGGAASRGEQG